MPKLFCHLLMVFLFSCIIWQAQAQTVVQKVRLGQHGEMTRLVLESNKPIKPEHFSLPHPPRFVLDFSKANFKVNVDQVDLPKGGLIKGLREGLFKPNVTRMVVDLNKPVTASVFNILASDGKGHRLVVDLKSANAEQISRQKIDFKKRSKRRVQKTEIYATAPKKKDKVVVVLDPGHGGVDPGAVGKNRTYEKHVVLQIAKRLKSELEKNGKVEVHLTRDHDIFVPLKDRVRFAQRKNADLFVSIHADAHSNRRIKGGSVYVLSDRASDKEANRLARHANKGDLIAGVDMKDESKDVQNILIDLTQRETLNKSAVLASDILKTMERSIPVKKDKVAFAGFRVLKAPEIPSVLVEVTYLSNPREEKRLKHYDHQTRIARSIAKGVHNYIDKHRLN